MDPKYSLNPLILGYCFTMEGLPQRNHPRSGSLFSLRLCRSNPDHK